jgi:EAL domain-containing protein (putative c-di-GMP-specific phosphodiesterase class I)
MLRSLDTEAQLRHAIDQGELILQYQPIIRLVDNEVVGLEALVSWMHPTRGLLAHDEVVHVAEQSGLELSIDRFVLGAACREAERWNAVRTGREPLSIGVNISTSQLQRGDLTDVVMSALAEAGLAADRLVLEITVSPLLADSTRTIDQLNRLAGRHVRLWIDNFGTGHSSLTYLRRCPVDGIKIHESFVRDVATDPTAAALVTAIVHIGQTMNVDVVAEGLERPEQLVALRQAGCPLGQGTYFAPAMDAEAVERVLRAGQLTRPG